jgi:2-polyprenyl-6-methoxyphenol hydroxylase-like FAD-dependent oxidoreductase
MWGISRRRLDRELLDVAADEGVEIYQPARCEGVDPGPRPRIHLRDLTTNRLFDVDCRMAILADGKGTWNAKRPHPTSDLGIKTWFEDVDGPTDTIDLFGVHGHYGGVAPIEDRRWNAAFSVPVAAVARFRGNLDALMAQVIEENPNLTRRLVGARRGAEWIAAPLPRFGVRGAWPEKVIPIGNAAAALEPIGGEGMGLAMQSAFAAADWTDLHLAGKCNSVESLRRRMATLWRCRRTACRLMGILISRPATAQWMVRAAHGSSGVGAIALRLIGKTDARFVAATR